MSETLEATAGRLVEDYQAGRDVAELVEKIKDLLLNDQLHCVIYTSRSLIGVETDLELLEHSREKNKLSNITGVLLRHENYYIQALEGRKSDVMNLVRKISSDKRHENFLLVHSAAIPHRMFGKWAMMSAALTESAWKDCVDAFSHGNSRIDKIIAAFVDGAYRK